MREMALLYALQQLVQFPNCINDRIILNNKTDRFDFLLDITETEPPYVVVVFSHFFNDAKTTQQNNGQRKINYYLNMAKTLKSFVWIRNC